MLVKPSSTMRPVQLGLLLSSVPTFDHAHCVHYEVGLHEGDDGEDSGDAPSKGSTISRARYKLDMMLMIARRRFWQLNNYKDHWISLGCLSDLLSLC